MKFRHLIYTLSFALICVNASTNAQIITTVAGGATGHGGYWGDGGPATAAELGLFGGLAVDSNYNIYIVDGSNQRIRKVDGASGLINTIAGIGVAGYNGDGIPATNAKLNYPGLGCLDAFGNFYVNDGANYRLRKIDVSAHTITTFAGNGTLGFSGDGYPATAAAFDFQASVFDAYGNMILESSRDHRIRKISSSGIITTIAGTGISGNSGDGGPATAANVTPTANGICTDLFGNIFFSDSFCSVRKINVSSGIITRVAGAGAFMGSPYTGEGGPATTAHFAPEATAMDDTGNLYIVANSRILKVDTFGIIHTIAGIGVNGFSGDGGPATAAELFGPENVVLDRCGNVYIADFNNKRVRKVTYVSNCDSLLISLRNRDISNKDNNRVTIYPNPANETLHVDLAPAVIKSLIISNLPGQILINNEYNTQQVQTNIAALPAGVYFIKIIDNEGRKTVSKFIKQ